MIFYSVPKTYGLLWSILLSTAVVIWRLNGLFRAPTHEESRARKLRWHFDYSADWFLTKRISLFTYTNSLIGQIIIMPYAWYGTGYIRVPLTMLLMSFATAIYSQTRRKWCWVMKYSDVVFGHKASSDRSLLDWLCWNYVHRRCVVD